FLLVVVTAGIRAIPGLLRARMSGNEAAAIGTLRAINIGQASFSSACANGGYATDLADLVKRPTGRSVRFIDGDLNRNGVTTRGYIVRIERDQTPGTVEMRAAIACNGATGVLASSYFAVAAPVAPGSTGTRYFATDTRGTIFESASPIGNP